MLQLIDYTCLRDGEPLFQPVSTRISEGEIIQIAGPNGAGKTTLLRALCGLFDETEGNLSWQGKDIARDRFAFNEQLLFLGHQPAVKKSLTAKENLNWLYGVKGRANNTEQAIHNALAHVGLKGYADIPCSQMSAGQHRRVALARLYLDGSPLWVLDEPFTAIDVKGVAKLEQQFEAHAQAGGTVILTTHQALTIDNYTTLALEPVEYREQ